ncbi:hypothetical protein BC835DRAFT_1407907 [Cytidiella melzeri]|nr:hypothetical protein BC835DRAFT_1407907 [Cytidiella melzeri]
MTSTSPPQKQKAWLVVRKGLPKDAVVLNQQTDVPSKLAPGEVLIKVHAAALNPVGYKLMGLLPNFLVKRPQVAENDFAGVVVNGNGTDWQNGQEVYGIVSADVAFKNGQGALAEYLVVHSSRIVSRPPNLKPTEAAGLTLVGLTAWQALFNVAKLEPGQSIFINGGSTSVGMVAIQLAKSIGCTVTASASTQKEELLKSLGVDNFIDYKKAPVYKQLEENPPSPKFHVFLEAVGNTDVYMYSHSEKYLAPGGIFISVGPFPHGLSDIAEFLHLVFELVRPGFLGGTKRQWTLLKQLAFEDFKTYAEFVADGRVKPVVDSVFAFEDVQKAYDRIMSQRTSGKVVVRVDPTVE